MTEQAPISVGHDDLKPKSAWEVIAVTLKAKARNLPSEDDYEQADEVIKALRTHWLSPESLVRVADMTGDRISDIRITVQAILNGEGK